jgi:G:T-mismatch repair DNA endonuclease (very short patch repair protein)
VARDEKNRQELELLGWQVITVWECELTNEERLAKRLAGLLRERRK